MKKNRFAMACIVSALGSVLCASPATPNMADVYKKRCANCHGVKAEGVPKIEKREQMAVEKMPGAGVISDKDVNIYGSPLNHLSQEELFEKLQDLRNEDYDAKSPHSVMRKNLKKIEKREGKVSDEKMAEYIYTTFGPGAAK